MPLALRYRGSHIHVSQRSKATTVVTQAVSSAGAAVVERRQVLLGGMAVLAGGFSQVGQSSARPPSIAEVSKGGPGERDMFTTATGLRFANVSAGTGPVTKSGDLVLVDVVGRLEGGKVFLDTRKLGTPLAFQVGTAGKYVPEGLSQVVEGMTSGSVRLAVLPPSLGFGDKSVAMPDGVRVPPNAKLYYEVELLRCEQFTMGLACCIEATFQKHGGSCVKDAGAASSHEAALEKAAAAAVAKAG